MTPEVALLARLHAAGRAGRPPAPEDMAVLAERLEPFLCGAAELDQALGVRAAPGQRALLQQMALAERDRLLRRAFGQALSYSAHLPGGPPPYLLVLDVGRTLLVWDR